MKRHLLALCALIVTPLSFAGDSLADLEGAVAFTPAGDEDGAHAPWWLGELRLGLLYHEDSRLRRLLGGSGKLREDGYLDISVALLTQSPAWEMPSEVLDILLRPRALLGATINLGDGTSSAYAGLAWEWRPFDGVFLEASAAVAVHNGSTSNDPTPGRRNLGWNPIPRFAVAVGVDLDEHWRVMATIETLNNLDFAADNSGLSNIGVLVGYRF